MLDDTLDLSNLEDKTAIQDGNKKGKMKKRGVSFEHLLNELNKIDDCEAKQFRQQPQQQPKQKPPKIPDFDNRSILRLSLEEPESKTTNSSKFFVANQETKIKNKVKISSKTPTTGLIRGLQTPVAPATFSNAIESVESNDKDKSQFPQKLIREAPRGSVPSVFSKDEGIPGYVSAVRVKKSPTESPLVKVRMLHAGLEEKKTPPPVNGLITRINKVSPTVNEFEDGNVGYSSRNRFENYGEVEEGSKPYPSSLTDKQLSTVYRQVAKNNTVKISLPLVINPEKNPRRVMNFDINRELKFPKTTLASDQNGIGIDNALLGMRSSRPQIYEEESTTRRSELDTKRNSIEGHLYNNNKNHIKPNGLISQNFSGVRIPLGSDIVLRNIFERRTSQGIGAHTEGSVDRSPIPGKVFSDWGSAGSQTPTNTSDKARLAGRGEERASIFKKLAENELAKPLYVNQ